MSEEKEKLTPVKEFDNHIGKAFGAVALSAIAWIAMFVFADGYEMLGGSPIMVVIAILFHAALLYMLYRSGESKNPTLAVIALSILVLEFGLTVFFGFAEAMETHRGAGAGTGLALLGLWETIKAIRFLVRSSKLEVEAE